MKSKEYLEKMASIQKKILEYVDFEGVASIEGKFNDFKNLLSKIKIQKNQHELKSFLHLLLRISNNHHRSDHFFSKINQILELLKDDMRKYFSNLELFHIFKSNKRILLLLIEEKIMNFDESIVKRIIKGKYLDKKYPEYFQPEIQPFIKEEWFPKYVQNKETKKLEEEEDYDDDDDEYKNSKAKYYNYWVSIIQKELPDGFYERRKTGENDSFICRLIRKDLLNDFISYVNQNNYQLDSNIHQSIYETNNFLLKKKNNKTTLIEYAAFFGSIQIFKYLKSNEVELTPSLYNYAIHGNNAEIIHILEENQLENESDEQQFKESIKCHHIDISNYIQNNHLDNLNSNEEEEEESNALINSLKYYNFIFIENDKINESLFCYLCKYDYYIPVSILLSTKDIDINDEIIYQTIFFI